MEAGLLNFAEPTTHQSLWMGVSKTVAIILLLVLSVAFGILPVVWKSFRTNDKIMGVANAFSGGIFIAVGLMHLLPEAAESIEDYFEEKSPGEEHFPWTFLIALLSFTFILFIEKIAFDSHELLHTHDDHGHLAANPRKSILAIAGVVENCSSDEETEYKIVKKAVADKNSSDSDSKKKPLLEDPCRVGVQDDHNHGPNHHHHDQAHDAHDHAHDHDSDHKHEHHKHTHSKSLSHHSHALIPIDTGKDENFVEQTFKGIVSTKAKVAAKISVAQMIRRESEDHNHGQKATSALTPYLLLIALAFHGSFEGIAIGLSKTLASTWNLIIAVALHKWAEALTLGVAFSRGEVERSTAIKMILIFSSTGPLGVGIGWILSEGSDLISGIFMAISAGTFLYIAAAEIIVEEFSISKNKWLKFFFFIAGITIISLLWFVESAAEASAK